MSGEAGPDEPRQRIVRSRHGRRARLTPAPGTSTEPVPADTEDEPDAAPAASGEPAGPNDERMRRDVPPHY